MKRLLLLDNNVLVHLVEELYDADEMSFCKVFSRLGLEFREFWIPKTVKDEFLQTRHENKRASNRSVPPADLTDNTASSGVIRGGTERLRFAGDSAISYCLPAQPGATRRMSGLSVFGVENTRIKITRAIQFYDQGRRNPAHVRVIRIWRGEHEN